MAWAFFPTQFLPLHLPKMHWDLESPKENQAVICG